MVLESLTDFESMQNIISQHDATEGHWLYLHNQERIVTIVFFDMRNFTALTEYLAPYQVVEIVNTYLTIITESLTDQGGTLTSYTGDQVMAIFNAPHSMTNHAEKAIRAAQHTMDRIEAFNLSEGSNSLAAKASFGAGIESGHVMVGNIGSINHHNYTAIGDAVNVAARLCDLAPPSTLFIGDRAVGLASDRCVRELVVLGGRTLRGRKGPVQIYRSEHTYCSSASALSPQNRGYANKESLLGTQRANMPQMAEFMNIRISDAVAASPNGAI